MLIAVLENTARFELPDNINIHLVVNFEHTVCFHAQLIDISVQKYNSPSQKIGLPGLEHEVSLISHDLRR